MKNLYAKLSIVLLFGFIIGGAVVAKTTGTSLVQVFGNSVPGAVAAETNTTAPSLVSSSGSPLGVADIVEKASPAVVNVEAKVKVSNSAPNSLMNDPFFRQFFGQQFRVVPQEQYETSIGTGFLISQDGYILTNQHVVNNAASVSVTLSGQKDKMSATVVGQDYELDLAVLKIDGTNYPTLPMGNSDQMRVGDGVIAIGEPYGLDHTVTTGVVSAKGRPVTIEDRNYKNLIQTDAAINPGNSGGPLLNLQGQVIAINTAVNASAQGIGFAIPINTAQSVLQELMNGESIVRPYLGIRMTDVTDEVIQQLQLSAGTKGAVVVEVVSGSPAAQYGLVAADIIQKIDNTVIESGEDVQKAIEGMKVGQNITVEVLRQGKVIDLPVVLAAKP